MLQSLIVYFGNRYLSRIKNGTLHVSFWDGKKRTFGSGEPQMHMEIHSPHFFRRVGLHGDIGFGEAYMHKEWDAEDLTGVVRLFLNNSKEMGILSSDAKKSTFFNLMPIKNILLQRNRHNSKNNSRKNISHHYDLSNDFYRLFLDETMMYSCAVFEKECHSLYEAQMKKLRLLAQKMKLDGKSRVLEIGSGWGEMAALLGTQYGCKVDSVTLSKEQKAFADEKVRERGLEDKVQFHLRDYRDVKGVYDSIVSIEMFEAVGEKYFGQFFKTCEKLLKPDGVLVMQVITIPDQRFDAYAKGSDFIQKYIFPGGLLPSVERILNTTRNHSNFNLLHMEDFSEHYAYTIKLWKDRFNENLDEVRRLGFDETFIRMWNCYLAFCEAAFMTRNIGLAQLVFSRDRNSELNEGIYRGN